MTSEEKNRLRKEFSDLMLDLAENRTKLSNAEQEVSYLKMKRMAIEARMNNISKFFGNEKIFK